MCPDFSATRQWAQMWDSLSELKQVQQLVMSPRQHLDKWEASPVVKMLPS